MLQRMAREGSNIDKKKTGGLKSGLEVVGNPERTAARAIAKPSLEEG